jgi:1-acyl-sn-glycerol-3-phosphate acyltransferase
MLWLVVPLVLLFILWILLFIGNRARCADWGNWVLNGLSGLNRLFCIRYHGMPNQKVVFPINTGALLAGNHLSGLDGLLLQAVSSRPVRFMIAREETERFGLRWLFKEARVIPVDRTARPEQAFRAALQALKQGDVVGMFPQGKIGREGSLKRGLTKLAELAQVDVYPVYLDNIKGEGEIVASIYKRSEFVTVEIGQAIKVNANNSEAALKRLTSFLVRP